LKSVPGDSGENEEQVMDSNDTPTPDMEPTEPSAKERFRAQSGTVREDLRELGRVGREAAREKLDEARQAAEQALHGGRQKAEEIYDQGRRKAGDLEDQLIDYVREKPLKSLAIATGLGLVLGIFFNRR
jgi:ElaB/YqjD/DUF883 family membrane-anchored ribosome-binding protein